MIRPRSVRHPPIQGFAYHSAAGSLKLLAAFASQKVTDLDHQRQHNNAVINDGTETSSSFNYALSSYKIIITLCVIVPL